MGAEWPVIAAIILIGGSAPLWLPWVAMRLHYRITHGRWRDQT